MSACVSDYYLTLTSSGLMEMTNALCTINITKTGPISWHLRQCGKDVRTCTCMCSEGICTCTCTCTTTNENNARGFNIIIATLPFQLKFSNVSTLQSNLFYYDANVPQVKAAKKKNDGNCQ